MNDSKALVVPDNTVRIKEVGEIINSSPTNVGRFQARDALLTMFPGKGLVKLSEEIARDFDPNESELAISNFGAKLVPSASATSVLNAVRSYETGPALSHLDTYTGVIQSVNPKILSRRPWKFFITIWNPVASFFRSVKKAKTRIESAKRNLEIDKRGLVDKITGLESMEDSSMGQIEKLLLHAAAAEIVTAREEVELETLQLTDGKADLTLPKRISHQQITVARLHRRTLDLKAAAIRSLLDSNIADAGQKALVIIHDDVSFALDVLHAQFTQSLATAIILYQGKKAGERSMLLRKASADLAETTGGLLTEVAAQGNQYLTDATETLRALTELRNAVVEWSGKAQETADLARTTREAAEKQMLEISDSLQDAAKSFA